MRTFSSLIIILFIVSMAGCQTPPSNHNEKLGQYSKFTVGEMETEIDNLIAKMTLEEKIGQLNQFSGNPFDTQNPTDNNPDVKDQITMLKAGKIGSFLNLFGAERTREVQRIAVEETRLGIPVILGVDVIHGFKTTFPIPLAESNSWDPEVVKLSARMAAKEATAHGIHWTFAPMVDIARDARWGRITEGSGEDPYLGSVMAAARVKGFQGDDLTDKTTMLATAKHFAAYGGAEGGRDYNTVDISEATLREIYLPPFKAAVDANVGAFMSAFNEISGMPASGDPRLLRTILRHEWGWNGLLVSDWDSIGELMDHGFASDSAHAAELGMKAGVDIDMQSWTYYRNGVKLVKSGRVSEDIVDGLVRNVLRAKFRIGLFDDPYRYSDEEREKNETLNKEMMDAARYVAARSMVLLKNDDGVLPLSKTTRTIAVVGPFADSADDMLGAWSAQGHPDNVMTPLKGIRDAVGDNAQVLYSKGCEAESDKPESFTEALNLARRADVIIACVGEPRRLSGEAASVYDISLTGNQEAFLKALKATGKPVVVVLFNGRPLAMTWTAENMPTILEAWFPGSQAGPALADVLFGDYNPSGKLTTTFPRFVGGIPAYYNHKMTGRPGVKDDHFTSKYLGEPIPAITFPFGYGLSYSKFEYSDLKLSTNTLKKGETLTVSVSVKNVSNRDGEEVVQLYIRDLVGRTTRPVKELKRFEKAMFKAGESKVISFELTDADLQYWQPEGKWGTDPGTFKVFVGTNSVDVMETAFELVN